MREYFLIKIPNVIINAIMRNDFTSKKFQKYFFSSLYALILVLCLSTSFLNTINQNMSMTAIDKNTFKIEKLSIYASMPILSTLNPANIQTMPAMNKSVLFLTIIPLQMLFISIHPNKIVFEHCSYRFKKIRCFHRTFYFCIISLTGTIVFISSTLSQTKIFNLYLPVSGILIPFVIVAF